MMKTLKLLAGIILLAAAHATLADTYPYEHAGIISNIHADEGIVIIQDVAYGITSYTIIHEDGSKKLGPEFLREGQVVGFTSSQSGNRPQLREIWILDKMPNDMSLINKDMDE